MNPTFAELVDGAARSEGLNDYQLSAAVGLLSGNRVYSPKQIHRLRTGAVRHPDPEVVERLVVVLKLDPNEAFAAARVLPHGFKPEHFRQLQFFATQGGKVISRYVGTPGQQPPPVPLPDNVEEFEELVRRNRRLRPTLLKVAA